MRGTEAALREHTVLGFLTQHGVSAALSVRGGLGVLLRAGPGTQKTH